LFNHRPFLKGEITHFVKEFEGKRGDQEVENVFKVLEQTTELQSCEVDKVKSLCDSSLPQLHANLLVAQSMTNRILDQAINSEIVIIYFTPFAIRIIIYRERFIETLLLGTFIMYKSITVHSH
jgi:hypothetical protein